MIGPEAAPAGYGARAWPLFVALQVATVLAFLALALPGRNPFRVLAAAVRGWLVDPRFRLIAAISVLLIFVNIWETRNDARWTEAVVAARGTDYAPDIYALEGEMTARIQGVFDQAPLVWALGYLYVVGFPMLYVFVLVFFQERRRLRPAAAACWAFVLNYLAVLPFYLWMPVREAYLLSSARHRLVEWSPDFGAWFYSLSGVDNCFPSYHTSLTVSMMTLAWACGGRLKRVVLPVGAAVVAATLVLGIHWVTDVAVGIPLGLLCAWLGLRLTRPRSPLPPA